MSNELTDVRCPCGAEFQADSYDAGFIAGSGMCQNCDAALPPKDICTCPSGDGSLRHPCPAHPAPVEQAGGDERAAFEAWWQSAEVLKCKRDVAMEAWQARAALAQPSQAPTEGFTHFPELLESVQQMDAMLKANSAQAEAERPEVVARVVHSNPVVLEQCAPLNANDEMMTFAQHAASVARWAEMFNRVEQERDAALARVAELEKQEPVAHLRASDLERLNQPGIAGSAGSLWNGPREGFVPLYAAPVAQAQHSVPEGWVQSLPLKNHQPCKPNEDRANGYTIPIYSRPALVEEALRKLRAVLCDPIGNVVIDGSDGDREEVQQALGMLAAAPGKEVGHE
ncbi:hypothetical protein ACM7M3_29745 [Pseudomonas aeruginosa]